MQEPFVVLAVKQVGLSGWRLSLLKVRGLGAVLTKRKLGPDFVSACSLQLPPRVVPVALSLCKDGAST